MTDGGDQESTEKSAAPKRAAKAPGAFRTISEVANELELPQHVLRFWETKFQNVRPLKRGGGRRYYRPEDVTLLRQICDLLYSDGYTIKVVQKLFRESGGKPSSAAQTAQAAQSQPPGAHQSDALGSDVRTELRTVLNELEDLRGILKAS